MKRTGSLTNKNVCTICGYKNRLYSDYCYICGHKFSKKEKEFSYSHTSYSFINKLGEILNKFKITKIWKNKVFKVMLLIVFVILTIMSFNLNGKSVKLINNYKYQINYSKYYDEYYVLIDENATNIDLKLYVPKNCDKIVVEHYDELNMITNQQEFGTNNFINLKTTNEDYYLLNATYEDNTKSYIKINVRNRID